MDRRAWIMPDLFSPALFADYASGIDRALDLAMSHAADTTGDEFSEDRVFVFARESQRVAWTPFWRQA